MTDWRMIPIPRHMQALQRWKGYPIPFTVLRDKTGAPHFTINSQERTRRCLKEKRCSICGTRMARFWFVGGPRSAFHPQGGYSDIAMHYECLHYALQVCPYLAAPNYLRRIDAATLKPENVPDGAVAILMDTTQDPDRPPVFVAVAATGWKVEDRGTFPPVVKPTRPYLAVQYWRAGKQLTEAEGKALADKWMRQKGDAV